jgi:hypothetical protein
MRNYGEELAYWYLRLNGFFLITDFVQHNVKQIEVEVEGGENRLQWITSDSDALAVRNRFVEEELGNDWDQRLLDIIYPNKDPDGKNIFDKTIGIVCEVKAGAYTQKDLFKAEFLEYSFKRIGFLDHNTEEFKQNLDALITTHTVELNNDFRLVKLLITNKPPAQQPQNFISITLAEVVTFMRYRLNRDYKERDWTFFPSNLAQFIIWEGKY